MEMHGKHEELGQTTVFGKFRDLFAKGFDISQVALLGVSPGVRSGRSASPVHHGLAQLGKCVSNHSLQTQHEVFSLPIVLFASVQLIVGRQGCRGKPEAADTGGGMGGKTVR